MYCKLGPGEKRGGRKPGAMVTVVVLVVVVVVLVVVLGGVPLLLGNFRTAA